MNPVWAQDMRDLVELFVRRGLMTRPRPQTIEQVMAAHQSSVREHAAEIKRANRAKRKTK